MVTNKNPRSNPQHKIKLTNSTNYQQMQYFVFKNLFYLLKISQSNSFQQYLSSLTHQNFAVSPMVCQLNLVERFKDLKFEKKREVAMSPLQVFVQRSKKLLTLQDYPAELIQRLSAVPYFTFMRQLSYCDVSHFNWYLYYS